VDPNYFKRYRMETDLVGQEPCWPALPSGYRLLPWNETLLEAHAQAKYLSFQGEIDATVFPCLGELNGCRRLMGEITHKPGFLPEATWLAVCTGRDGRQLDPCGTIQGIRDLAGMGAVQNLGIAPEHRNRGVGTVLLLRALEGFRRAGLERVRLEVTADNLAAIRLYRRHGFTQVRTVFKAAEAVCS